MTFNWQFGTWDRCIGVYCVEFGESFQMSASTYSKTFWRRYSREWAAFCRNHAPSAFLFSGVDTSNNPSPYWLEIQRRSLPFAYFGRCPPNRKWMSLLETRRRARSCSKRSARSATPRRRAVQLSRARLCGI